jgi:hypothetical protein
MSTIRCAAALLLTVMLVSHHVAPSRGDGTALAVKDCVAVCVECVQLFSKDTYDGRKCIFTCHLTKGKTRDDMCANSVFHLI